MQSKTVKYQGFHNEDYKTIDNNSEFEYSFELDNPSCTLSFEVKALSCDPFEREEGINLVDGQKLIKPFFSSLKGSDLFSKYPEHIVLKTSTHHRQVRDNIKKMVEKCEGNRLTKNKLYCFGVMCITRSTSFDEFYSYLFNQSQGQYPRILAIVFQETLLRFLHAHSPLLATFSHIWLHYLENF